MSISLSALGARAIVLDIEGTTTPLTFVTGVLFPFARAHAAGFLEREANAPECRAAAALLQSEQAADRARGEEPPEGFLEYVGWLMDRDRKSPGLKALQGLIWKEGYRSGELRGQVYADVLPALARWKARGIAVSIYSSGSVLAQRLLFSTTPAGDLTAHFDAFFDTAIGPKTAPESYAAIAERIVAAPPEALFVSDMPNELDAARAAGMRTALCVRDPGGDAPEQNPHPVVRSFDEIV